MSEKNIKSDKFVIFSCQKFVSFSSEQKNDKLKFVINIICHFRYLFDKSLTNKYLSSVFSANNTVTQKWIISKSMLFYIQLYMSTSQWHNMEDIIWIFQNIFEWQKHESAIAGSWSAITTIVLSSQKCSKQLYTTLIYALKISQQNILLQFMLVEAR